VGFYPFRGPDAPCTQTRILSAREAPHQDIADDFCSGLYCVPMTRLSRAASTTAGVTPCTFRSSLCHRIVHLLLLLSSPTIHNEALASLGPRLELNGPLLGPRLGETNLQGVAMALCP